MTETPITLQTETYKGHEIVVEHVPEYTGEYSHRNQHLVVRLDGKNYYGWDASWSDDEAERQAAQVKLITKARKSVDLALADDAVRADYERLVRNLKATDRDDAEWILRPANTCYVGEVVAVYAMGQHRVGRVEKVAKKNATVGYTTASSGGRIFHKAAGEVYAKATPETATPAAPETTDAPAPVQAKEVAPMTSKTDTKVTVSTPEPEAPYALVGDRVHRPTCKRIADKEVTVLHPESVRQMLHDGTGKLASCCKPGAPAAAATPKDAAQAVPSRSEHKARTDKASAELRKVRAWEANGKQGKRPASPTLDAMRAEYTKTHNHGLTGGGLVTYFGGDAETTTSTPPEAAGAPEPAPSGDKRQRLGEDERRAVVAELMAAGVTRSGMNKALRARGIAASRAWTRPLMDELAATVKVAS